MVTSRSAAPLGVYLILTSLGLVAGCDDDDDLTAPAPTVVAAFRDPLASFSSESTFAFVDTVVQLAPFGSGVAIPMSRQYDIAVLDRVRLNLLARGFVEETQPRTNQPDFVVLVGATAQQNYQAWISYPWYTWYGFYPGWGFYAPGFDATWGVVYPWGATATVTSFDQGTLVVTLIDALHVQPLTRTVNALWAGVASTVLDGTLTEQEVLDAVDEMFIKSPYLRR